MNVPPFPLKPYHLVVFSTWMGTAERKKIRTDVLDDKGNNELLEAKILLRRTSSEPWRAENAKLMARIGINNAKNEIKRLNDDRVNIHFDSKSKAAAVLSECGKIISRLNRFAKSDELNKLIAQLQVIQNDLNRRKADDSSEFANLKLGDCLDDQHSMEDYTRLFSDVNTIIERMNKVTTEKCQATIAKLELEIKGHDGVSQHPSQDSDKIDYCLYYNHKPQGVSEPLQIIFYASGNQGSWQSDMANIKSLQQANPQAVIVGWNPPGVMDSISSTAIDNQEQLIAPAIELIRHLQQHLPEELGLKDQKEVANAQITLCGQSLGGSIVTQIANKIATEKDVPNLVVTRSFDKYHHAANVLIATRVPLLSWPLKFVIPLLYRNFSLNTAKVLRENTGLAQKTTVVDVENDSVLKNTKDDARLGASNLPTNVKSLSTNSVNTDAHNDLYENLKLGSTASSQVSTSLLKGIFDHIMQAAPQTTRRSLSAPLTTSEVKVDIKVLSLAATIAKSRKNPAAGLVNKATVGPAFALATAHLDAKVRESKISSKRDTIQTDDVHPSSMRV